MTLKCRNCGTLNDDNYKFCVRCGAPLTVQPRICPNCHKPVPIDATICPHCMITLPVSKGSQATVPTTARYPSVSQIDPANRPIKRKRMFSSWFLSIIVIILFIVLWSLIAQDPRNSILLAISIIPGIAIIWYFRYLDKEKEPLSVIVAVFLVGAVTTILAIIIEYMLLFGFAVVLVVIQLGSEVPPYLLELVFMLFMSFIIAGATEETMKYFSIKYIINDPVFNEPYDGVFYGVVGAIGFATIENIMYVIQSSNPFLVGALRGVLAVPMHALTGGLIGYYLMANRSSDLVNKKTIIDILKVPVAIHGLYDFILIFANHSIFQPNNGIAVGIALLLNVGLLIWVFFFLKAKIKILQNEGPFATATFVE